MNIKKLKENIRNSNKHIHCKLERVLDFPDNIDCDDAFTYYELWETLTDYCNDVIESGILTFRFNNDEGNDNLTLFFNEVGINRLAPTNLISELNCVPIKKLEDIEFSEFDVVDLYYYLNKVASFSKPLDDVYIKNFPFESITDDVINNGQLSSEALVMFNTYLGIGDRIKDFDFINVIHTCFVGDKSFQKIILDDHKEYINKMYGENQNKLRGLLLTNPQLIDILDYEIFNRSIIEEIIKQKFNYCSFATPEYIEENDLEKQLLTYFRLNINEIKNCKDYYFVLNNIDNRRKIHDLLLQISNTQFYGSPSKDEVLKLIFDVITNEDVIIKLLLHKNETISYFIDQSYFIDKITNFYNLKGSYSKRNNEYCNFRVYTYNKIYKKNTSCIGRIFSRFLCDEKHRQ